jgi:PTH1 family peptidyl-tRNA hydrolase
LKMIAGLGNPGTTYAHTRHNIGFMVVDRLAQVLGVSAEKKQGHALVAQEVYKGERLLLVKPQTYMNLSGEAILELLNFYKNGIDDLIVIHDDLDLELGRIRFKSGGGTGGHRGLKSITEMLNSDSYDRLKVGIGRPPEFMKTESYVLQAFSTEEKLLLDKVLAKAVEGIEYWITEGCAKAMNQYNALNLGTKTE